MENKVFLIALLLTSTSEIFTEEIIFKPLLNTYEEGDNVTLTCNHNPENTCKWLRSGQEVDFELEKRYITDDLTYCTFTISTIRADDDAKWKCVMSNSTSTDSNTLTKRLTVDDLNFNNGAHLLTIEPSSIEVEEGGNAQLKCDFNASAPACFWTKDGEVVAIEGRHQFTGDKYDGDCSIEIVNVNDRDDGHWQCCYPKMDDWPLVKSSNITLNVLVAPIEPVISVQGIGMDGGDKVFISTTSTSRRQTASVSPGYRIACWSEKGNPAATLTWSFEYLDGNALNFMDDSRQSMWTLKGHRNLNVSYRPLYLIQTTGLQDKLHRIKVSCNAHHPSYMGKVKTTFIWMTWVNTVTLSSRYY